MNFVSAISLAGPRVVVTSTFPDALNRNPTVRSDLADGFAELLGTERVSLAPLELAVSVIRATRPDVVVAVGSLVPDLSDLRGLRRAADAVGAVLIFWLTDDPYEFDYAFKAELYADIVVSNDSWAAQHYRHPDVHHLPLAAAPNRHFRPIRPVAERETTVFFCGVAYPNRIALLRRIDDLLAHHVVEILGAEWPDTISCAVNRRLTPRQMADYAAASRITLNIGRDLDVANRRLSLPQATPGPRTFEVALSGSAQAYFVTGLEICDHFEPDAEILLVDGAADIARVIEQSLDDPASIELVARRAQARALREHTYRHRAARLLDLTRMTVMA
ncbi:glycosyltransferase [Methylobacterium sp. A49B]